MDCIKCHMWARKVLSKDLHSNQYGLKCLFQDPCGLQSSWDFMPPHTGPFAFVVSEPLQSTSGHNSLLLLQGYSYLIGCVSNQGSFQVVSKKYLTCKASPVTLPSLLSFSLMLWCMISLFDTFSLPHPLCVKSKWRTRAEGQTWIQLVETAGKVHFCPHWPAQCTAVTVQNWVTDLDPEITAASHQQPFPNILSSW